MWSEAPESMIQGLLGGTIVVFKAKPKLPASTKEVEAVVGETK